MTVTFGIPGSASTWVYNIVRELRLLEHSSKDVESFYSDAVARVWEVFQTHRHMGRVVIWKLHEPDAAWSAYLSQNRFPMVLSIRDPRDAMASLMDRFGATWQSALDRVSVALNRMGESVGHPHAGLRYESRFFEQPETAGALAEYLGIAITETEKSRIFETYTTQAVSHLAQSIDSLPDGRIKKIDGMHYDELTQIHRKHIGDQRVGKWRGRFDAEERKLLNGHFKPFLDALGYDSD